MDNWFKEDKEGLKTFLDEKYAQYARPTFIDDDPICIPHDFEDKRDQEIAGLFAATLAWGRRDLIIRSARALLKLMEYQPYEFIAQAKEPEYARLINFRHRTFLGNDLIYFCKALKAAYADFDSLENLFAVPAEHRNLKTGIVNFRKFMLQFHPEKRMEKHLANPDKGSAAKRLNMFLRWMVREDQVDLGIWKSIKTSQLSCPLDVHVGNMAREFGLLSRKQNDWKAVEELDQNLRSLDSTDPVKYDLALFGIGRYEFK